MPKRIQFRRDTDANWTLHNPRLLQGEIGMSTDGQYFKIGDGVLDWEDLPQYMSIETMEEALEGLVGEATTLAEGYATAAAGSAATAAAQASSATASAAEANAWADAAEIAAAAAAAPSDATVAALVADDGSDTNDAIEELIDTALDALDLGGTGVPAGVVEMFAGSSAPTGYLLCNGAAVSRSTYSALFSEIGTTWGAGNGTTTFNVPDMRGFFPLGVSGSHALATTGGAEAVALTSVNQLPSHNHGGTTGTESATHTHSGTTSSNGAHTHEATQSHATAFGMQAGGNIVSDDVYDSHTTSSNGAHTHTITTGTESATHTHTISSQGASATHENMPPFKSLNYIIKT